MSLARRNGAIVSCALLLSLSSCDGGAAEDAGLTDGGAVGSVDAGASDAGASDAGASDAATPDAGPADASAPDAGRPAVCAPSRTVHCKGPISLTNVTVRDNALPRGVTDVWEFTYESSRAGSFAAHHGNVKDAIISRVPDGSLDNPLDPRCVHRPWFTESSFVFAEASVADRWECPLVNGETYYLKLRISESASAGDANYYLVTNSAPR